VFPLSQSKCSSPYAAKRALALFLLEMQILSGFVIL
jgi:hypothetical protein